MRIYILNKKRIGIILILLIISVSIIKVQKMEKAIQTIAWANKSKTIILDAGHGIPDERRI